MAIPNSAAGTIDDLGVLITACFGLDTSWMDDGVCRGWTYGDDIPRPSPWQMSSHQTVQIPGDDGEQREVSGRQLITYALTHCYSCPAQYDCAEYGVRGMMRGGTWGMRIGKLVALQDMDPERAAALIATARRKRLPVQAIDVSVDNAPEPA